MAVIPEPALSSSGKGPVQTQDAARDKQHSVMQRVPYGSCGPNPGSGGDALGSHGILKSLGMAVIFTILLFLLGSSEHWSV